MREQIKKYIFYISYYLIIVVLLFSGIAKLIDPLPTIETLNAVNFFDNEVNIFITTSLSLVEIGLALVLISKNYLKIVTVIITLIFIGFLFFAIYGYAIGLNEDCGCFGEIIKSQFKEGMLIRNVILSILGVILIYNRGHIIKTKR